MQFTIQFVLQLTKDIKIKIDFKILEKLGLIL